VPPGAEARGSVQVLGMLSAGRRRPQDPTNPEHSQALSVASGRLSEEQPTGPSAKDGGNMEGMRQICSQLLATAADRGVGVEGE